MQTEVATENILDSEELEARQRSAETWRWRIYSLPFILSVLMVPGCIVAIVMAPHNFAMIGHAVGHAVFWAAFSLVFVMPPMGYLAWVVGRPVIYRAPKLFFMVIGVAIGLLIVIGNYWILVGAVLAAVASESDAAFVAPYLIVPILKFIILPAIPIAAVAGGVWGLLYGKFQTPKFGEF